MKFIKRTMWAVAIGCSCSGGLVMPAKALIVTFDRTALLGQLELEAGRGGGGEQRRSLHVDPWTHMIPGTGTDGVRGTTSLPLGNRFDSWLDADLEVNEVHTGIVLDGSYAYLVTRSGSATSVWRLAALVGRHNLLSNLDGAGARFPNSFVRGLMANGTVAAPVEADVKAAGVDGVSVNDTGSTVALLGLSLGSLGLIRRQSGSSQLLPHP